MKRPFGKYLEYFREILFCRVEEHTLIVLIQDFHPRLEPDQGPHGLCVTLDGSDHQRSHAVQVPSVDVCAAEKQIK